MPYSFEVVVHFAAFESFGILVLPDKLIFLFEWYFSEGEFESVHSFGYK